MSLASNKLSKLPSDMYLLAAVQALDLSENMIHELPEGFVEMKALEALVTCARTHTCTHRYAYAHADTHTCTHTRGYTHMHTYTHVQTHTHAHTHTRTHSHTHAHTHTHTHFLENLVSCACTHAQTQTHTTHTCK